MQKKSRTAEKAEVVGGSDISERLPPELEEIPRVQKQQLEFQVKLKNLAPSTILYLCQEKHRSIDIRSLLDTPNFQPPRNSQQSPRQKPSNYLHLILVRHSKLSTPPEFTAVP